MNAGVMSGGLDAQVVSWRTAVLAAGGTLSTSTLGYANNLVRGIIGQSFSTKIKYLTLLGADLSAARVPLLNANGFGNANVFNFVNGDYTEAHGLQATGSTMMDLRFKMSQLGTGGNGGLGYWENNYTTGGWAVGVYPGTGNDSEIYGIDLTSGSLRAWYGNSGLTYAPTGNGHWYLNRSSSTNRKLYLNGALVVTNTTSHTVNNINLAGTVNVGGITLDNGFTVTRFFGTGRCAVVYATDGTFTDAEAAAFHSVLSSTLITPTGR